MSSTLTTPPESSGLSPHEASPVEASGVFETTPGEAYWAK